MNVFNFNLCHSIKNKKDFNTQCPNKHIKDENFCGVHINSKKIVLFKKDSIPIDQNAMEVTAIDVTAINIAAMDIEEIDDAKADISKIIYSKEELIEKILKNSTINVYTLRKSIRNCDLAKFIDTKQTKQNLITSLKKIILKERFYFSHQSYIILIQSFVRKWLIYRRKLCSNDTDILTFTDKYEIPEKYFYIFFDKNTKKRYGYDIRTLLEIINSDYPSCPYTFRQFTNEEIESINLYKTKLINKGVNILNDKKILTLEEEIDMKIKDVFYQINMLDNYTNHVWFKNLNLTQLVYLYKIMEDIWNYRSNMNLESKKKIVKNGIIFSVPVYVIDQQKSKIKMQNLLLNEFTRLITEGVDREEKKLGAILALTGLVEVSGEAADGLPHLIQV